MRKTVTNAEAIRMSEAATLAERRRIVRYLRAAANQISGRWDDETVSVCDLKRGAVSDIADDIASGDFIDGDEASA